MKSGHLLTLCLLLISTHILQAQLPDGSIGPDFTVTDINGNTYTLYDILDEGKSVVLDFSATWCGPCWNYHQTHRLQDLYDDYGPAGTNEIEVFMLEADLGTNENCLYGPAGCNSSTYGDWTAGVTYPIVNLTSGNGGTIPNDYNLNYYPTLYKICPNRKVYEVGQASLQTWINWVSSCNLDATEVVTNEICFDDGNGMVDLTTVGGHGSVSYSWSNGATTEDLVNPGPGSYSCTITEGQGHSIEIGPFDVSGPSSALVAMVDNIGDVNCNGNNNGFIHNTVTGGEPGYIYQWSNGAATEDLNNLSGGFYELTVTDNLGCTETLSATIEEPPVLTLTTVSLGENCDQQDGSILLFAAGGTSQYTYDIGTGPSSSNIFQNLVAGSYVATVFDGNNCLETELTIVEAIEGPTADAGQDQIIDCNENTTQLDGGGSSSGDDIIYLWTTGDGNIVEGEDSQTPTIDAPGTYLLTVMNVITSCQSIDEVVVQGDVNAPEADAGEDGELNCTVSTATLDGSNSSTGSNITYEWYDENAQLIGSEITAETTIPGIYQLIVTNTSNGCTAEAYVDITENMDAPVSDAGNDDVLTCIVQIITLDGSNSSTGSNITYEWLDENDEVISTEMTTDIDEPGMYRLVVTDTENTCTDEASVEITENLDTPVADAGTGDELNCELILVTLDGSSSTSGNNIEFEWSNENDEVLGTTDTLDVEVPGTYELLVTNSESGCTDLSTVTVTEDVESPTADAGDGNELNCEVTVIILDGSNSSTGDDFAYEWQDVNGNTVGTGVTTEVDSASTYRLVVTDTSNACTDESEVEVTENIETPDADAGEDNVLDCAVSSVTLDGSNSTTGNNISYLWLNEANDTLAEEPAYETQVPGVYTLLVTNTESACTDEADVEVTEDVEPPLVDAGDGSELNCVTNSVELDGSGSSSGDNISYEWTNAAGEIIGTEAIAETETPGIFTLTLTNESNACQSASSVEITENLDTPVADAGEGGELSCTVSVITLDGSGSSTGDDIAYEWQNTAGVTIATSLMVDISTEDDYTLIVTNTVNGCTASSEVTVTASTIFPEAVVASSGDLSCSNTTTQLDGSESSTGPNYSYEWLNSNDEVLSNELQTGVSVPDTYTLVVSDNENGCTASSDIVVEQNIQAPDAVIESPPGIDCSNTVSTLDGSGSTAGTPAYQWLNPNGVVIGNTETIDVSEPGNYTLILTETENGCTDEATVAVAEDLESPLAVATAEGTITCASPTAGISGNGSSEGSIFEYQWTGGDILEGEDGLSPIVAQAGIYTLLITNNENGCTASAQVQVPEDVEVPTASCLPPPALNCNLTSIELDGSGSSAGPEFEYSWTTNGGSIVEGQSTWSPVIDAGGLYTLLVTNTANGCSSSTTIEVEEIPEVNVQLAEISHVSCFGTADGHLLVEVDGGLMPYQYEWSNGINTNQQQNVPAGDYTVLITDENGCTASEVFTVEQPEELQINASSTNESSLNGNDGTAGVDPGGGSGNYTYLWNTGATTESINGLAPGEYSVLVTDENGCSKTASITIESFTCNLMASIDEQHISCFGATDGIATVLPSGDNSNTYLWSTGETTTSIQNLSAGIYTVSVLDANNCEAVAQVEITEPEVLQATITDEIPAQCTNSQDGSATIVAMGGTGTMSFHWSNNETTETATQLEAGPYSVVISDENACSITLEGELSAVDDTPPVVLTQNITIPLDEDGFAVFNALQIDNGSFDNCGLANIVLDQTSFDCTQLGVQTVTLMVTDINGNASSATAEVTVTDDMTPTMTCSPDIISNSCSGVEYSLPVAVDNCAVSLELVEGLPSGAVFPEGETVVTYQATDPAGNHTACSFTVLVEYDFNTSLETVDVSCGGLADGTATVITEGGTPGFSYAWSDGQTSETATQLAAGNYSVLVTDATGCTSEHFFEIVQPDPIELQIEDVVNEMENNGMGAVNISVSGGNAPYEYAWYSNGELVSTSEDLTNVPAGAYELVITDADGCQMESGPIMIDNITSAHEPGLANAVKIWPNPTSGLVQVSIERPQLETIHLKLFDVTGKQLHVFKDDNNSNRQIDLDLSGYANGVYILMISTRNTVYTEKLILEKF